MGLVMRYTQIARYDSQSSKFRAENSSKHVQGVDTDVMTGMQVNLVSLRFALERSGPEHKANTFHSMLMLSPFAEYAPHASSF